jgi:hypothetical protein
MRIPGKTKIFIGMVLDSVAVVILLGLVLWGEWVLEVFI